MRIFCFFSFLFLTAGLFANSVDRINVNGYYFGKNLVVINPMIGDRFVVESVEVNGNRTNDEIQSSVFEIDFLALGLQQGEKVSIAINYYTGNQKPVIFNPEALEPASNFSFTSAVLDRKTEMLEWTITGSPGNEKFEVEQYRWEKWVRVTSVDPKDSIRINTYHSKIVPHSGKNMFRIKLVDEKGNIIYSTPVKLASKLPEVFLEKTTVETEIVFSSETMYQIYDEKGVKWLSGTGATVDISTLASGKYWVNYDNKTELVKKK